jgi:ACS family hexuronate transporter-like MFS transporter
MAGQPRAAAARNPAPAGARLPPLRWVVCGLLFFASTINYVDRQTISVLKPYLQVALHWSESDYGWIVFSFQLSYALMMVVSGRLIDWLGTRLGFALTMVWWSLAAMAHALAQSAFSFAAARFALGAGEAGNFPASIKAVAEWFPEQERALATGLFNAGTNIGAVAAPPLVIYLTLHASWRLAFVATGSLGFLWLIFWLAIYRKPPASLDATSRNSGEGQPKMAQSFQGSHREWKRLLHTRQAWGFILAKFMTDPIWWFYIFWIPSYLSQARGFSLAQIGYFAWIPFLAADIGSVAGGWASGYLMERGWPVNSARKVTLAACALLMPAGIAAVLSSHTWLALALISISTSAHQGWSANLYTLVCDMFPQREVASVTGLGGAGGAVGGMIIAPVAGYVLQWFHTYVPLFIIAGVMHPLAMIVLQIVVPRIKRVQIS